MTYFEPITLNLV